MRTQRAEDWPCARRGAPEEEEVFTQEDEKYLSAETLARLRRIQLEGDEDADSGSDGEDYDYDDDEDLEVEL